MNSQSDTIDEEELRERLIDKLDDQRFGDNVVNKKLLYKDIEWIVDELLDEFKSLLLRERARSEKTGYNKGYHSGYKAGQRNSISRDGEIAREQLSERRLSRLSGEESHE